MPTTGSSRYSGKNSRNGGDVLDEAVDVLAAQRRVGAVQADQIRRHRHGVELLDPTIEQFLFGVRHTAEHLPPQGFRNDARRLG